MKNTDVAWAAGFWEGEGGCRGRVKITVEANATQTCKAPLLYLKQLYGGSVYPNNEATRKKNPHKLKVWKRCWAWCVNGIKARIFLQTIRPYVKSPKKLKQLDKALSCPMGHRSWWPDMPDKVRAIRKAIDALMTGKRNGKVAQQIAKRFGVSRKVVYNIREEYIGRKTSRILRMKP